MKRLTLILIVCLSGITVPAIAQEYVVRQANWYDTPGQIKVKETVRHLSIEERTGMLEITYEDTIETRTANLDLDISYIFARISTDEPPVLVEVSIDMTYEDIYYHIENKWYLFLAVGERLQNRYGSMDYIEEAVQRTAYDVKYYETGEDLFQIWSTGITHITHSFRNRVNYSVTNSTELRATAKDLYDLTNLERVRAELNEKGGF